ncbi:UBP-type zinc finger domain-containing protein [Yinghuangia soli]|uniref:UBP-type zinc finger domain-containing protein n=1 Tax=Yinghuangia soli TaxID=2908204 RepID=A0AA41PXX2_9ACTN|nr:UBP-type zinc finger domain-containing protein [Yinghuangia soli]MCF2527632.1 UBP-type zinc finger domain-containing protein [Yinghuangia soli]
MSTTRYEVAQEVRGQEGAQCAHLGQVQDVTPSTLEGCEDCLKAGGTWVHLRECLACGHIGCCDNSPNRHATGHWKGAQHPVVRSFEPGEAWAWCYDDQLFLLPAE